MIPFAVYRITEIPNGTKLAGNLFKFPIFVRPPAPSLEPPLGLEAILECDQIQAAGERNRVRMFACHDASCNAAMFQQQLYCVTDVVG